MAHKLDKIYDVCYNKLMAYKNKSDQAASSNRHYHRNKEEIIKKNGQRRREAIAFIRSLKQKPCTDCGIIYPSYVMDFDHIDDNKLMNVSQMGYFSKEKILEEVNKCELVCANCHRIRTHEKLKNT